MVGDGAGIVCLGATAEAFVVSGVAAVAEELDVEIVNFQIVGFKQVNVQNSRHFPQLFVSKLCWMQTS